MDKRWLCLTVFLAVCAANISDDLPDDYFGLFNDGSWGEMQDDEYEYGPLADINLEEKVDDDKVYVRPEDGDDDMIDRQRWASDHNDNEGIDVDTEPRKYDKEQIPSINELAGDEIDDVEEQNYDFIDKEKNEQIINEKINSDSEENADQTILEAIQQALAEDTVIQNEGKLDEDYQVEDNRAQVQNKFDEANEGETVEDFLSNLQNSNLFQENINEGNLLEKTKGTKQLEDTEGLVLPQEVTETEVDDNQGKFDKEDANESVVNNTFLDKSQVKNEQEEGRGILVPQEEEDNKAENNDDNYYAEKDIDQNASTDLDQIRDDVDSIMVEIFGAKNNLQEAESNSEKKENHVYNSNENIGDMRDDQFDETRNKEAFDNGNQETLNDDKENLQQSGDIDAERKMVEESFNDETIESDEDTVNKVYDDLKVDLDALFSTLDKLAENDSDETFNEQLSEEKNADDIDIIKSASSDNEVLSEEKNGDDIDIIKSASPDSDVNQSPEKTQAVLETEVENQEFIDSGEERVLKIRQDYYDSMKDYNFDYGEDDEPVFDDQQKENVDENSKHINENEEIELSKEIFNQSDNKKETEDSELEEQIEDKEAYKEAQTMLDKVLKTIPEPLVYFNDGILNKNSVEEQNQQLELVEDIDKTTQTQQKKFENDEIVDTNVRESLEPAIKLPIEEKTEDLTSAEVNNLMTQFAIDHSDDLDINSKNFDRDVAPVYISLKVGEPVVIESPNYPNPYPTNNIVDWIIDGEGMGIEINVTDLAVNGIVGDYLLVKPGGIDESGTDGLIFSYQLRSERRYRFLDVNRMFIRFQSQPGMSLLSNRGFQLSVKLLMPLSEEQASIPEPEAIIQPPQHTLQVYLAGVTPRQFANQSEEFRLIVADMAVLYVNRMGVEYEDVNITEVTQITQVATCNVNWPGFERCAGVSFGVPLFDDEESGLTEDQLRDMWNSYVDVDPFAARLRRMGITEFAIPNDRSTLLVWLMIGAGVAISAGMLALALWRWSCFEDYTRMPAFSDTDSVIGDHKRNLDLYPTPHQTLPPLYDDDLIKYEDTARVDMGGFANKSYAREGELLDLESDDDLGVMPVKRDRSSNIQPKDIYQV